MNTLRKLLLIAAAVAFSGTSSATTHAAEPSARDIMVKSEQARRVKDIAASATLTTTGAGVDTKVKSFAYWQKLASDGTHFRTLTKFHTPAEIRGEAILIEEHPNNQNDVLLYLPKFKKIRRVEARSQSSSFMGSAFSYSDLAAPHVDDFSHRLLKTEACPAEPNVQCHVIESNPSTENVKERTGYSKLTQWIRLDNFMVVRGVALDIDGSVRKTITATNIREVDPREHKWLAHTVRVEDSKTKRTSTFHIDQVKANTGVPDSTFSQANLQSE